MSDLLPAHVAYLRIRRYSPISIASAVACLERFETILAPSGLLGSSAEEIDIALGQDEWRDWTVCTYYGHIHRFLLWAYKGGHLSVDTSALITRPPTPECIPNPITDDELALILTRATGVRRTAVLLAAYAGLRVGEIAALNREDVTEERIHILRGKGGRPGYVPTHPVIWEDVGWRRPGRLVTGRDGRALVGNDVSVLGRYFFNRIGLPHVHFHRLRHWTGTKVLELSHDLRAVQEILRHKNIKSTQGYTQVTDGQRRLAICTLPILASPQQEAA